MMKINHKKNNYKFNYLYKIIILTGSFKDHYYIGAHSTDKLDDNYFASGSVIKKWYKAEDRVQNVDYVRTIIEYNDSVDKNLKREIELIGDKWETDPLCLNQKPGGDRNITCGFKGHKHSVETKAVLSALKKGKTSWNKGIPMSSEAKAKMIQSKKGQPGPNKGKTWSEETKLKISQAKKNNPYPHVGYTKGQHRVYDDNGHYHYER